LLQLLALRILARETNHQEPSGRYFRFGHPNPYEYRRCDGVAKHRNKKDNNDEDKCYDTESSAPVPDERVLRVCHDLFQREPALRPVSCGRPGEIMQAHPHHGHGKPDRAEAVFVSAMECCHLYKRGNRPVQLFPNTPRARGRCVVVIVIILGRGLSILEGNGPLVHFAGYGWVFGSLPRYDAAPNNRLHWAVHDCLQIRVGANIVSRFIPFHFCVRCRKGLLKRPGFKTQQRPPTAVETMLWINVYSLFLLIPLALTTGQMGEGIRLLKDSEQLRMNVAILNGVVSIGQIFIFLCIDWYSSLVTTTITTTRKFFTILFSVLHFGHSFTAGQWVSVLMVFGGLYLSIASGNKLNAGKSVPEGKKVD
jgi:hypothetical protein